VNLRFGEAAEQTVTTAWGLWLEGVMTVLLKGAPVEVGKIDSWAHRGALQPIDDARGSLVRRGIGEVLGSVAVVGKSIRGETGEAFYRVRSPNTSGTTSRIHPSAELKIDSRFDEDSK
jgi:hypothetical protein